MRHITRVIVLIVASAAFLAAQTDPPGRVGRLNYMDGPVSFQPAGVNDWVDATINRPLIPGDNIWVGDRGRAELHVGSTALRLGANTAFQFLNLDDQTVQIRLSEGTLTVRMRNLAQNQVFEVDTPNLAFTLLRPGEYRIDANPDSQTTIITVRDGEGDVTGGGQAFPVYARQQVVVRGDDQISYNLASAPGADAWDQWCSSRDRREDQSQSARYVSREMAGYEDLDQYGRWDNQPGYGNVWMPTSVAAGWAPYHDGHWAWIAPWGWTWVDDAPWGFAPYHYGRWASFGGRWGWIPGPYGVTPVYAPALVAWIGGGRGGSGFSLSFSIGTAAAVGWFPLGPREPYFPSYQASQGYFTRVNNTNTVINNTTINNYYDYSRNSNNTAITNIQYVNRNVQNGVTAVPQDNFARGRRVTQDARAVPAAQLASVQVFGAPAIAPQRESVLGARADTASRAARPPANVLSRPVVARTAPPPAPVPFDRQQPALAKNPGRPLPTTQVQQIRQSAPAPSAPVRVVDMGRVKRVQPFNDGGCWTTGRAASRRSLLLSQQQQKQQQDVPAAATEAAAGCRSSNNRSSSRTSSSSSRNSSRTFSGSSNRNSSRTPSSSSRNSSRTPSSSNNRNNSRTPTAAAAETAAGRPAAAATEAAAGRPAAAAETAAGRRSSSSNRRHNNSRTPSGRIRSSSRTPAAQQQAAADVRHKQQQQQPTAAAAKTKGNSRDPQKRTNAVTPARSSDASRKGNRSHV